MGTCLSKKSVCATAPVTLPSPPENPKPKEEAVVKKEVFIIKHRNSHEVDRTAQKSDEERAESNRPEVLTENGGTGSPVSSAGNVNSGVFGGAGVPAAVRTSCCTKEEVDAILIQCGRLSRSNSTGKAAPSSESGGPKYSGSKRSYDFDHESGRDGKTGEEDATATAARERENRRRERHRQSPRRRTPSRERDRDQASQPRSGSSRERGGVSGGRRVSRSPGKRSESPVSTHSNSLTADANLRPGKMVSVPATVPSLAVDKNEPTTGGGIKRIQVKRNLASPRARSPARIRATNENPPPQPQPVSLSRSNSRKAENSPYRRNPLAEIDTNIVPQKPASETRKTCPKPDTGEEAKGPFLTSQNVAVNVILSSSSVQENPKSQTGVFKSRSSRELDINPETLTDPNPPTSYTALLLEDIQNFHQKNSSSNPPPSFTLPACVTKAQSILEAVADLNSSTGSNFSTTCFERSNRPVSGKSKPEVKQHPILESEVVSNDDLMEPSFHKYVTVRRGGGKAGGDEVEDQESSGSNSYAGGGSQWVAASSCSWEPNSAESTDRWTTASEPAKRRENGIGRGRIGGSRGCSA